MATDTSYLRNVSILQRRRVTFERNIQQGPQVAQGLEAHEGLFLELHAYAGGCVEHPGRDMEAVATLVAGHMAAQDMRVGAALLASDKHLLSEEGMPQIRDTP